MAMSDGCGECAGRSGDAADAQGVSLAHARFPAADIDSRCGRMPSARGCRSRAWKSLAVTPIGDSFRRGTCPKSVRMKTTLLPWPKNCSALPLGGKNNFGLDCSGLVEVSLNACGISCLRDSDMKGATWAHGSIHQSKICSGATTSLERSCRHCARQNDDDDATASTWGWRLSRLRKLSRASGRQVQKSQV